MKGIRYKFFLSFFLLLSHNLLPQSVNIRTYKSFISGNRHAWLNEIKIHESQKLSNLNLKFERIELYYVYTGFLLADKNYSEASKYIQKADVLINDIIKFEPKNASALAFKGSFTGFKIPMNRLKILQLGNESFRNLHLAYHFDPDNLQVLTDLGSALFFTPRIFGGDKMLSIQYFEKAVKIIESSQSTLYNWKYMNILTLLANSYEKTDQVKNADLTYQKILKIEPDYLRVKNLLYPAFLKAKIIHKQLIFNSTLTDKII
jgi:tetratricopeptide (TPR) repeat protein